MIARVFPRKTAASPNDELAFFGVPTIDAIATCIRRGVTAVHISVTFTYEIDHFIHRGRAEVTHWMPLPEAPKEESK